MSSEDSSAYSDSEDEDYDCNGRPSRSRLDTRQAPGDVQDYAQMYARLDDDVLGEESEDDGDEIDLFDSGISGKKGTRGGTSACYARRVVSLRDCFACCACVSLFSLDLTHDGAGERDGELRETPYMFFDFRHGPSQWPEVTINEPISLVFDFLYSWHAPMVLWTSH
jgi:hypothetical protein